MPTFDNDEWNTIISLKDELLNKGWDCHWDTSLGADSVYLFKELTVANGHVVEMDLSGCNLSGDFPWSVFKLPYLEELNLSGNNLSGDIGTGMLAAIAVNPNATANLKTVNISNNKFSGNIALFAKSCPALQTLDASCNAISDVVPMISPNVTTLNVAKQTIDRIVDVDLANFTPTSIASEFPTVLLYDHQSQTYKQDMNLLCTAADVEDYDIYNSNEWGIRLLYEDGVLSIPAVSARQQEYHGESGDILNVMNMETDYTKEGSTFKMRLSFAPGDANFTGNVDITDLQAIISQIFGKYSNIHNPFNYTAANMVKDDVLNVQDVVGEVNLLLADDEGTATQAKRYAVPLESTDLSPASAAVYCSGGELRIYSPEPVAAFDVVVAGATAMTVADRLSSLGMTYTVKETANGTHIIGYSLCGSSLPAGETSIALFSGGSAAVRSAALSDEAATAIPVAVNTVPTSIQNTDTAPVNVEMIDGRLYIITGGSANDVSWNVSALDGRVLGKGVIPGRTSGRNAIDLDVDGIVIVTLKSDNFKLIRKITNNK